MGYTLGVDLGTTYTAAAVLDGGRSEVVELGLRTSTVPSVVLLREDETVLTGEAASRRALTEPDRVAREFKRRVGDTTPLLLGGTPMSAEALMARLLRSVVDTVTERQGGPPDRVAVCHPANWGPYKTDLLRQAVRLAGLESARLLTEPEAAAIHYASQERVEPGATIAVYDLGGGTFDSAVLRKTETGWEVLGQPEGIERLGGVDFDAAVLAFVDRALGGKLSELDPDDPMALSALTRLRDECITAKESLSGDDDVSIPVLLPNVQTEVVLTRDEFERMIRPALVDSLEALRRAVSSAGIDPAELSAVLLVGGSSRIPLVARMVEETLGRPVALDVHPKHAVAHGAALAAFASPGRAGTPSPSVPLPVAGSSASAAPIVPAPDAASSPGAVVVPSSNDTIITPLPSALPVSSEPPAPNPSAMPPVTPEVIVLPPMDDLLASGQAIHLATGTDGVPNSGGGTGNRRVLVLALSAVLGMFLVGGLIASGGSDRGDRRNRDVAIGGEGTLGDRLEDITGDIEATDETDPETDFTDPTDAIGGPAATLPADVSALDDPDYGDSGLSVDCDRNQQLCITRIDWNGDDMEVHYETNKDLTLDLAEDVDYDRYHAHFYLRPVDAEADTAGTQAGDERGSWAEWATSEVFAPSYANENLGESGFTRDDVGDNTELCGIPAKDNHEVLVGSEYCFPIPP